MACWFEYNGKRYEPDELVGALKAMTPTEAAKYIPEIKPVPEAPFQKNWHELALKDAIREAAEKGIDRISWTPGSAQIQRYWGSQPVAESVARWNEVTKPNSVRELGDNVLGREMAAAMPLDTVDGGMLAALHHDQIRRAVISELPVNVVNHLRAAKVSPEQLLRDPNVAISNLPPDHLRLVADGLLGAMRKTAALLRTKLGSLDPARPNEELLPALKASQLSPREVAGLLDSKRLFHDGAGGSPETSASAGSGAKPLSGSSGSVSRREVGSAELARLLNAHSEIVHGREGLLQQGFTEPPGEGMVGFYDKMIPDALNKIGKPHGVKVQSGVTRSSGSKPTQHADFEAWQRAEKEGMPVHYMDIPQSLKDQALKKGFSLFEDSAAAGAPIAAIEHAGHHPAIQQAFHDEMGPQAGQSAYEEYLAAHGGQ